MSVHATILAWLLFSYFLLSAQAAEERPGTAPAVLSRNQFVNPIGEGADPWVVRDPNQDRYLWCLSEGNTAIAIHTSQTPTSLGTKHVVWRAPQSGPLSQQVWAPELHFLDGRWYIYFAASDGDNANHLAYVLVSQSEDPLGDYKLEGPLFTGDKLPATQVASAGAAPQPLSNPPAVNIWAIDMTVLEHAGRRYAIWSGWDEPGSDRQFLYIAPMKSPVELAAPRVRLCDNDDYPWEFTDGDGKGRGLNEAPQVLQHAGHTFLMYSCGGSWLPTYKLGMLELTGNDPLDPQSWTKSERPVFSGTSDTFGVGHSCFVRSANDEFFWHVFHAKMDRNPGWRRGIFVQPMNFDEESGKPLFGNPIAAGVPQAIDTRLPTQSPDLSGDLLSDPNRWQYFGHHQRYAFDSRGVRLGIRPAAPVNDFDTGEKLVLTGFDAADVRVTAVIDQERHADDGSAGILFRIRGPALGYDAHQGYYAGVNIRRGYVLLGKMDGKQFELLQRVDVDLDPERPAQLMVHAHDAELTVRINGRDVIQLSDRDYAVGGVGLRVVRAEAHFSNFSAQ